MVREGRTNKEDTLHESYFRESEIQREGEKESQAHTNVATNQTNPIPPQIFEEAKKAYYRIRGWDERTGYPHRETLVDLGLKDIAEELFR